MNAAAAPLPPDAQGRMQAWLAASPLMQACVGGADGHVWAASGAWCAWYGTTATAAVGRAYRDVVGDGRFARHGLHLGQQGGDGLFAARIHGGDGQGGRLAVNLLLHDARVDRAPGLRARFPVHVKAQLGLDGGNHFLDAHGVLPVMRCGLHQNTAAMPCQAKIAGWRTIAVIDHRKPA